MSARAFGEVLRKTFRVQEAPAFVARTLRNVQITAVEINCRTADNGLSEPMPAEDAFLVVTHLRDCPEHEMFFDGRAIPTGRLPAGSASIYDLRAKPQANSISPFHHVSLYIPRRALNLIAEIEGLGAVDALDNDAGFGVADPVLHGLSTCLLPAFERPEEISMLHIDHLTVAAAVHVVRTYGACAGRAGSDRIEALAPWQEERAKAMLREHLDGAVTLGDLAQACDLPPLAFARRFRASVGMAPHRWLAQMRRDQAQTLLARTPPILLEEIARRSGFRSVAHLVRELGGDVAASGGPGSFGQ